MDADPGELARADQDLAWTQQYLRTIIELWRDDRTSYTDPVARVARLMFLMSDTNPISLQALLACAVEQLAAEAA